VAKKIDFLIAKVKPFKLTLDGMDSKTKAGHVPIQMAENFNKVLDAIRQESPDAAAELPENIHLQSRAFSMIGATDMSYSGLEILVGQVLGVLDVLKHDN
jgi:hypothetical protein